MIKLDAKTENLKLTLEITADGITKQVFTDPKYVLSKRLQAVSIGLRSELIMFLLEVEKEIGTRN